MGECPVEDYKYNKFIKFFSPTETPQKVGFALFGLGRAGTIHLRNLINSTRVELLYVIDSSSNRREEIKNGHGLSNVKFLDELHIDEALDDPRVQAVLIATPTFTHEAYAIGALKKGKAVFCEKPIAHEIENVKKCYEVADKLGLPLLCAFNRRFDPHFGTIHKRVKEGELGKVHVVKTCSRDSPLPSMDYLKISNGIYHDCAVHDIDLVCWVLGEYPKSVYATGIAYSKEIGELGDHDTVIIQLTFPSNALAVIDLSRHGVYGYDQRLEVLGTGGMLSCGNQNSVGIQHYKAGRIEESPILYSFASRYDEAYKNELDHFLNVIQGKENIGITSRETLAVCRIALACEESVKTGNPVTIAYD